MGISRSFACTLALLFLHAGPAFSATWDGGGADGLASNPMNWSGDTLPAGGEGLFFTGASPKDCTWDLLPGGGKELFRPRHRGLRREGFDHRGPYAFGKL